jgi:hypothetical protein
MNLDYPLAKEFHEGKVLVSATLHQYLEATGQEATFLDRSDVESKWAEAVGSGGGIVDEKRKWLVEARYATARAAFARRVAAETGADQVLMPSLMVREGRYSGTNLRWDGVMRRLDMKNQNPHASTRISGKDLALSIRVSIFDADGELVFEQLGGIEPITAYEHTAGKVTEMDSGSVKRRIRDDLFEDDAILRDSVRVALTPLIEAPQGWLP